MPSSVTIDLPRLVRNTVTGICADTTVSVVDSETGGSWHDGTGNIWVCLQMNGRVHYPLVMRKHVYGRPELEEAIQQALALIEAAIAAEKAEGQ